MLAETMRKSKSISISDWRLDFKWLLLKHPALATTGRINCGIWPSPLVALYVHLKCTYSKPSHAVTPKPVALFRCLETKHWVWLSKTSKLTTLAKWARCRLPKMTPCCLREEAARQTSRNGRRKLQSSWSRPPVTMRRKNWTRGWRSCLMVWQYSRCVSDGRWWWFVAMIANDLINGAVNILLNV